MLPRRSLRLRQLNGKKGSTSIASSTSTSTDGVSKSIDKITKKRTRRGPNSEIEEENQPKQKRMKLAANNLESFPAEILEKIFIETDDIGLLNLTSTCTRFRAIAKNVFAKRYADKYFEIMDEKFGGDREVYAAQFNRFGNSIKAIQLNDIEDIDSENWAKKIIQPHINQIEKIMFNGCHFQSDVFLLRRLGNLTHLILFRNKWFNRKYRIDLPECHNLLVLEIENTCFTVKSFKQMIRNNPGLQRVKLKNFYSSLNYVSIISLIADQLKDIKELVVYDEDDEFWDSPPSVSTVERIVKSFKFRLESLCINVSDDLLELLQCLGKESKSLKHLGLHSRGDDEINNATIRSFPQIESLRLMGFASNVLTLDYLANLRQLTIEIYDSHKNENKYSDVLPFLQQCQALQQITMIFRSMIFPNDFITAEFFERFNEIITITGKPNARMKVFNRNEINDIDLVEIGSITVDGVIWRSKLMYWMGCNQNDTSTQLLDLAEHPDKSDKTEDAANRTNLLDKICDYLDLRSLVALGEINKQSKQLVNNFVEKRVNKRKTFITSDELYSDVYFNDYWKHLNEFKYIRMITDLNVCILNYSSANISKIIKKFKLLNKLSIYNKCFYIYWPKGKLVQKNLLHIVYDSPYCMDYSNLIDIVEGFAELETIEFKNAGLFNDLKSTKSNAKKFGKLKKFIFNYRGETQMKNLKKIFENTTVQLVPIYSQNLP